jgi:flavin-dependent dehydrogenase
MNVAFRSAKERPFAERKATKAGLEQTLTGSGPSSVSIARSQSESLKDEPGSRRTDVVIVGGGPAGMATALTLARAGYSVTVMERSRYETFRIGETLPPEVQRPLIDLGLWDQFLAEGHLESPGIVSAWGQPDLYHNDFIVNPHGPGWHIDRRYFDAMLANAALAAGVEVLIEAKPTACVLGRSSRWSVQALVNGMRLERLGSMLVDATGRSLSPARSLGGHRIVHDRLVALLGLMPAGVAARPGDRRTLVEAVETGWWYSAPLPDGRRIASFMTDGDLIPRGAGARALFRRQQLERAPHTRACLGQRAFHDEPWLAAACSSRPAQLASPGWLAVGDAVASFDPLSQQGVTWALESALQAARAIDAHFQGDPLALDNYAHWVEAEFAGYLVLRAEYYGRERRWPGFPFWRRRHVTQSSSFPFIEEFSIEKSVSIVSGN